MFKPIELFSDPSCRRYSAPRCSFAYLFSVVCTIILVVVPFLALGRRERRESFHEQPSLSFDYRMALVAQAVDRETLEPSEVFFSTVDAANDLRSHSFRSATLQSRETDEDYDGRPDQFTLSTTVPLSPREDIFSVQAILLFDCKLQHRAKIATETLIYASHSSGLPGKSFTTHGDFSFRQTQPLRISATHARAYDDKDLFDDVPSLLGLHMSESSIQSLLRRYSERNIAADYVERFPVWTRSAHSESSTDANEFSFTITMDIPPQEISIVPTLVDVLKEAWIRYLSIFVCVLYLLRRVLRFAYLHQIFETRVTFDAANYQRAMRQDR